MHDGGSDAKNSRAESKGLGSKGDIKETLIKEH